MYSEELQTVLRRFGWSPERKVDTRDWIEQLAKKRITVVPEAESILQNLGGLEIVPMKTPADAYAAGIIRFDPVTDILSEVNRIEFWQTKLGQTLSPLGIILPYDSILLLGANGQVFCEWGNIISDCGKSFNDALQFVLVFARRKPFNRKVDSNGELVPV